MAIIAPLESPAPGSALPVHSTWPSPQPNVRVLQSLHNYTSRFLRPVQSLAIAQEHLKVPAVASPQAQALTWCCLEYPNILKPLSTHALTRFLARPCGAFSSTPDSVHIPERPCRTRLWYVCPNLLSSSRSVKEMLIVTYRERSTCRLSRR